MSRLKLISHHPIRYFLPLLLVLLSHCSPDRQPAPLMELLPPHQTGIDFENTLREDENLNILTFEYFYNGSGVGIGDLNNDGLNDIFFAANMSNNRLYLNQGNFKFSDITKTAGIHGQEKWATGVSLVDLNEDGWLDIYVCYAGPHADSTKRANELYINNKNNTFTEQAGLYGLADTGFSVQAAFFDYDLDGDLDVYLLTNITDKTGPNVIRPKRIHCEMINTDRLYRNNGDHTFTNISKEAGITIEGYGLGVSVNDLNQDGWPDIMVSNDYLSNDLVYVNNRNGTFSNKAEQYFKHTSYSAMGNDVSDFNNDGLLDMMEVDMLPPDNLRQKLMFGATNYDRYRSEIQLGYAPQFMRNMLQLNEGNDQQGQPLFSEIGQLANVQATDWSWSPLFADIDNDGWKDLLVTNGYPRDITNRDFVSYRMQEFLQEQTGTEQKKKQMLKAINSIEGAHLPIFCFQNNGSLIFSDQSTNWGFTTPAYSNGAAYGDLDNDGDLDYVTNNINGPAFVFKNHANEYYHNHFLRIRFRGSNHNLQGYGTGVSIYTNGELQHQEKAPCRGYQSTVEQSLHFGLGKHLVIDSIVIQWPDHKFQTIKQVKADQELLIKYSDAKPSLQPAKENPDNNRPHLQVADKGLGISYVHLETEYADFKIQPLLPHKYSENGPGIAVADVNGDGREDFFVGGAFKQSGQFFIQSMNGGFSSKPLTTHTKYEEDMGVLFFDADNDGDQDLYIVSGGNEFAAGSSYYQDRLFMNDGKGNFKINTNALPASTASGSCVIATDYDNDGDLDLFVGGRLTPQHYPQAGHSFILQNNHGQFTDVTEKVAPGLQNIGMITSAMWTDIDNDNQFDLMVVGEWMPITIFKNNNGVFQRISIPNSCGWWNSVQAADFDEDGDTDYVLGNLGLNTKYKTSTHEPVQAYVDDYTHDGYPEAILSQYIQGINRPAHPRDDLFQQMVQFKKKYPSYKAYAEATMETLLEGTGVPLTQFKSETFQSSLLINEGLNGWTLTALPIQAQFGPVYGLVTYDFDSDGHVDIILTGNSYATDVLTGRYDALKGLFLKGNGAGNFKPLNAKESGVLIDGNAKGLALLTNGQKETLLLATQNNDSLRVLKNYSVADRTIPVKDQDVYAILTYSNKKKVKQEFYFGSGYLSQSSRTLRISKEVKTITIYDRLGNSRIVDNP